MLTRRERHLLDPQVPKHRGIVLCRMLQLHPLREPLSQGVGLFGLLSSSRFGLYHLSSSRPAPSRILSGHLTLTTTIDVSSVGIRVTSLRCAPKQNNPRGKLSLESIKTEAKGTMSKSGRAGLTSPTWLIFLRELQ